jgi:hypothetical protein
MRPLLSGLLLAFVLPAVLADEPKPVALFNGKDFTGWEGDTEKTWKIEDGAIVGGSLETTVPRNEFHWTVCICSGIMPFSSVLQLGGFYHESGRLLLYPVLFPRTAQG